MTTKKETLQSRLEDLGFSITKKTTHKGTTSTELDGIEQLLQEEIRKLLLEN